MCSYSRILSYLYRPSITFYLTKSNEGTSSFPIPCHKIIIKSNSTLSNISHFLNISLRKLQQFRRSLKSELKTFPGHYRLIQRSYPAPTGPICSAVYTYREHTRPYAIGERNKFLEFIGTSAVFIILY